MSGLDSQTKCDTRYIRDGHGTEIWRSRAAARFRQDVPSGNAPATRLRIEDGQAWPSDAPGLGIDWDRDAVRAARIEGSDWETG